MIELRCDRHKHMDLDPDLVSVLVKCGWCSKTKGRPVFHEWKILDIITAYRRGETSGTVAPTDPMVRWVVRSVRPI